jgi:hypothetical protein
MLCYFIIQSASLNPNHLIQTQESALFGLAFASDGNVWPELFEKELNAAVHLNTPRIVAAALHKPFLIQIECQAVVFWSWEHMLPLF